MQNSNFFYLKNREKEKSRERTEQNAVELFTSLSILKCDVSQGCVDIYSRRDSSEGQKPPKEGEKTGE